MEEAKADSTDRAPEVKVSNNEETEGGKVGAAQDTTKVKIESAEEKNDNAGGMPMEIDSDKTDQPAISDTIENKSVNEDGNSPSKTATEGLEPESTKAENENANNTDEQTEKSEQTSEGEKPSTPSREYKTRRSGRVSVDDKSGITPRKRTGSSNGSDEVPKKKSGRLVSTKQEGGQPKPQPGIVDADHDKFCWVCHKEEVHYVCKICPRSYHKKCIEVSEPPQTEISNASDTETRIIMCPECAIIMKAEQVETRSETMKRLSCEQLAQMLTHICGRIRSIPGIEPFLEPVQEDDAEDYSAFVINPMDVQTLEDNISKKNYGSTEAFLSDAQWILHNCIVFNSTQSTYTKTARKVITMIKQEISEIEVCVECYGNAIKKTGNWFVQACYRPHILVWGKVKGYPYWPGKAVRVHPNNTQVDVRFFGQHDRGWVNLKECFLYSLEMPQANPGKKVPGTGGLNMAIEELNEHVEKLKEKFGDVVFAESKIPLDPSLTVDQLQLMLPNYRPDKTEVGTESDESNPPKLRTTRLSAKADDVNMLSKTEVAKAGEVRNETGKKDQDPNATVGNDQKTEDYRNDVSSSYFDAVGLVPLNKDNQAAKGIGGTPIENDTKLRKSARLSSGEAGTSEANHIPKMLNQEDDGKPSTKAQNLMEQISSQTHTKPGYRFNLSKDISISAVDPIDDDEDQGADTLDKNTGVKNSVLRTGAVKLEGKVDQGGNRGVVGNQRMMSLKDAQGKPILGSVAVKNSKTSLMSSLRPSIKKGKDGSYQSIPGNRGGIGGQGGAGPGQPIALPGGNIITISPLDGGSAMPSTRGTVNGAPMAGGGHVQRGANTKLVRPMQQQHQRQVSSSGMSPTVANHLQQCLRAVEEAYKKGADQAYAEGHSVGAKKAFAKTNSQSERETHLIQKLQQTQIELRELRQSYESSIKELRGQLETEKKRALQEKRHSEQEKLKQINEIKKKQWCAHCGKEALFYCCWNTSYCDYDCQAQHWATHMERCTQGSSTNRLSNQSQLQNGGK